MLGLKRVLLEERPVLAPRRPRRAQVVEPAGSEGLVHVDAVDTRLVARVRPDELPAVGQRVRLAIRPDDVHRFGADGKRLG